MTGHTKPTGDLRLNSQWSAIVGKKAGSILGCIKSSMANSMRKVILLSALPLQGHIRNSVQFWAPQVKKDRELLGQSSGGPQK